MQPVQEVAALLHRRETAGIRLDLGGVVPHGRRELGDVREDGIQQLAPLRNRSVEPLQTPQQLPRPREAGRFERLLQLLAQAAQLVGVGQALGLDVECCVLTGLRSSAGDFLHDVAQVVGLAAHLFLAVVKVGLAPLQGAQALTRVADRHRFHRRGGVGIEDVPLGIRAQQGLRLVLAVQVHEQGAQLGEHADRRRAAVHPGAGFPFPVDFALHDQHAVRPLHPQGGKRR